MEFLYSANRLNVATSRAKCICVVVASPRLFEAECRTPRQMQLANAFLSVFGNGGRDLISPRKRKMYAASCDHFGDCDKNPVPGMRRSTDKEITQTE